MVYKVQSTLEAFVTSAYFFLEGETIYLSYDGEATYKSTDLLDVDDGMLEVVLRVYGLNGTDWKLKLIITQPNDTDFNKEYEREGRILRNQTDLLNETIDLANESEEV